MNRFNSLFGVSIVLGLLIGCTTGPTMLRISRMGYNHAIQQTTNEQLLLNLVRLKYRDVPLFVEVGSVSAQFQFDHSASISGSFSEDVGVRPAGSIRADGRVGFVDRPTITFSPLQGGEFSTRLLSPLSLDTIVLLIRSGWSVDRVMRLCVQQMNALDNALRASGPTPDTVPVYDEFAEASSLIRLLQIAGLLEVGRAHSRSVLSPPMDPKSVGAGDLIAAAREGFRFEEINNRYVLTGSPSTMVVSITKDAIETKAGKRLIELLGLAWDSKTEGIATYQLTFGAMQQTTADGETGNHTHISIVPRSLMGVLFYLSHAIEAPADHRAAGLVTTTLDVDGNEFDWANITGDLLRIRTQRSRPNHAAVKVEYRNHWFYIDDRDLPSKTTFALLVQLFALQAGSAEGLTPVLTLPVG